LLDGDDDLFCLSENRGMKMIKTELLQRMSEAGVIAVIRAKSKDQLVGISEALLAGGVPSIEVTMSTPSAIEGIAMLCERFGERAIVGVGTVTDAQTCKAAIDAGAQFVVSPMFDDAIVRTTREAGRVSIPGAFTVTEIWRAWTAGADVVKVFPSTALGPQYFKDILAPLPQLKLTPTGGVDAGNTAAWLKAGAIFVGAGSALVSKEALANNDWPAITSNAKAFGEAVRSARAK
jgi:2-dehydro-3-deoxyphosphogluconate aldolase / (4S)-4-hydroxy-2-oxoglutarate aldolase